MNYTTIILVPKENYTIIQLNRGRANPMNFEMLEELKQAFLDIQNDDAIKGVILTGQPGFFSAGLDIIELATYDRQKMADFWMLLAQCLGTLASFSKPFVSAINGHSPAGGCVLANCSDYRIMLNGKFKIGLNEVPVGIILPEFIFQNYAFWVGKGKAYQYVMEGKLHTVEQALNANLIDEIVEKPEDLMKQAELKLNQYISFTPNVWSTTKNNLRRELIKYYNNVSSETFKPGLDQWFSEETQAIIKAMIERLKGGK